jgi:hypothetical protein
MCERRTAEIDVAVSTTTTSSQKMSGKTESLNKWVVEAKREDGIYLQ